MFVLAVSISLLLLLWVLQFCYFLKKQKVFFLTMVLLLLLNMYYLCISIYLHCVLWREGMHCTFIKEELRILSYIIQYSRLKHSSFHTYICFVSPTNLISSYQTLWKTRVQHFKRKGQDRGVLTKNEVVGFLYVTRWHCGLDLKWWRGMTERKVVVKFVSKLLYFPEECKVMWCDDTCIVCKKLFW